MGVKLRRGEFGLEVEIVPEPWSFGADDKVRAMSPDAFELLKVAQDATHERANEMRLNASAIYESEDGR